MDMDNIRTEDRWHVVARCLEYEGELRAAFLRVVLVAAFYGAQLLHFSVFAQRTEAEQMFHRQSTYVAAGWLFVSLAVLVALTRHWLPRWLKYVTVGVDLILLTLIAAIGSGPNSPIVVVFWVVVALAALRCNLGLIWFGTIGAMAAYLCLVGLRDPVWFDAEHVTAPIEQVVVHLSLAGAGLVAGQLVRMMRQVTADVFARQSTKQEDPS
jgi:hypothetical protein